MLALSIIRHSLGLLLRNWRAALKISTIPFLILLIGSYVQLSLLREWLGTAAGSYAGLDSVPGVNKSLVIQMLAILLPMYLGVLWAAVSWHRHVLLDEPATFLPPLRAGRIISYFGHSLLISLIMIGLAMPLLLLASALSHVIPSSPAIFGRDWFPFLTIVIVSLALINVGLRLSTGLPAAALGLPKPLSTGWRATRGHVGCFVVLAAIGLAVQYILEWVLAPSDAMLNFITMRSVLPQLIAQWLTIIVAVSVLTTTYGHFVQGRKLD